MSTEAKNIHLTDDRLAELTRAAQAQDKTPDELADEAIAMLLRKRRFQDLLARGERYGRDSGYTEDQVPDVVHEFRREQRSR